MPPRLRSASDPGEWLRHARSSEQDYREALEAAEKAVAWAEGLVRGQATP